MMVYFYLNYSSEVFFLYRISFLWYSGIGFIITVVLGLIGSIVTGAEDPRDVDADLISPTISELLTSLPLKAKEVLNLPTHKATANGKDINLSGVVNVTLNLKDEEPVKMIPDYKQRKISSISVHF